MFGPKWFRIAMVLFVGIGGIAGIGLYYVYKIQPGEPVWFDEAHVWPREDLPLKVWLAPELRGDYDVSARAAIKNWNNNTCKLFEYVTDQPSPHALGVVAVTHEGIMADAPEKAATTFLRLNPGPVRGLIRIHRIMDIRAMMFAIAHELGHVLGLQHDPRAFSLMFENVTEYADKSPMPLLTSKDRVAVARRYCE